MQRSVPRFKRCTAFVQRFWSSATPILVVAGNIPRRRRKGRTCFYPWRVIPVIFPYLPRVKPAVNITTGNNTSPREGTGKLQRTADTLRLCSITIYHSVFCAKICAGDSSFKAPNTMTYPLPIQPKLLLSQHRLCPPLT